LPGDSQGDNAARHPVEGESVCGFAAGAGLPPPVPARGRLGSLGELLAAAAEEHLHVNAQ